jgi:hypothetical protein
MNTGSCSFVGPAVERLDTQLKFLTHHQNQLLKSLQMLQCGIDGSSTRWQQSRVAEVAMVLVQSAELPLVIALCVKNPATRRAKALETWCGFSCLAPALPNLHALRMLNRNYNTLYKRLSVKTDNN